MDTSDRAPSPSKDPNTSTGGASPPSARRGRRGIAVMAVFVALASAAALLASRDSAAWRAALRPERAADASTADVTAALATALPAAPAPATRAPERAPAAVRARPVAAVRAEPAAPPASAAVTAPAENAESAAAAAPPEAPAIAETMPDGARAAEPLVASVTAPPEHDAGAAPVPAAVAPSAAGGVAVAALWAPGSPPAPAPVAAWPPHIAVTAPGVRAKPHLPEADCMRGPLRGARGLKQDAKVLVHVAPDGRAAEVELLAGALDGEPAADAIRSAVRACRFVPAEDAEGHAVPTPHVLQLLFVRADG
jgi:hypothetical protein